MFQFRIISGGQTGADRAALDAALSVGVRCGGWCPAGRKAEDGPIDPKYPLVELPGAGYRQRTKQNVIDSDGTAIIAFGPLTGGSKLTADFCQRLDRPCLIIDAELTTPGEAAMLLAVFMLRHRIHAMNVAGPRASRQPGVYEFLFDVMTRLLRPGRHSGRFDSPLRRHTMP